MIHSNSVTALRQISNEGSKQIRSEAVLACYSDGVPRTDRQVLKMLYPQSDDMNKVKPRISELLKYDGLKNPNPPIIEWGSIKCSVTGKNVRLCKIKNFKAQMELIW